MFPEKRDLAPRDPWELLLLLQTVVQPQGGALASVDDKED